MSDFNPDVAFLGFQVPAGETYSLSDLITDDDDGIAVRPHITNIALGPNPKPGRHTVIAEASGLKAVVGTLEMRRCEQFQVDLVARDLTFSHTGASEVHLTGYCTSSSPYLEGMSDQDDDEESEDDDDVPAGVPLNRSQLMPSKKAVAKQQSMLDDGASSSGDEDDDDDDDEEDDSDEDEDTAARKEMGIAYLKKTLTSQPLNGNAEPDDDDDTEDDDEEDDDDDDDDEVGNLAGLEADSDESSEEDSGSEDEPKQAQPPKAVAVPGKRSAPPKVTPQPSKKAKITAAAAVAKPQTAAPASQSGVSGPAAAQWQSALKAYLIQSGGETDMSKLGGVKKPEGVSKGHKLKAFLQQHSDVFALDGNTVTLKK